MHSLRYIATYLLICTRCDNWKTTANQLLHKMYVVHIDPLKLLNLVLKDLHYCKLQQIE